MAWTYVGLFVDSYNSTKCPVTLQYDTIHYNRIWYDMIQYITIGYDMIQ